MCFNILFFDTRHLGNVFSFIWIELDKGIFQGLEEAKTPAIEKVLNYFPL